MPHQGWRHSFYAVFWALFTEKMTFNFVNMVSLIRSISILLCINHKIFYLSRSTTACLFAKYFLGIKQVIPRISYNIKLPSRNFCNFSWTKPPWSSSFRNFSIINFLFLIKLWLMMLSIRSIPQLINFIICFIWAISWWNLQIHFFILL